jgi:hypothetical protein
MHFHLQILDHVWQRMELRRTFSISVVQAHRVHFYQHLILAGRRTIHLFHPELIQAVLAGHPLLDLLRRRHRLSNCKY